MKIIVSSIAVGLLLASCSHTRCHPDECECDECNLAPIELLHGKG